MKYKLILLALVTSLSLIGCANQHVIKSHFAERFSPDIRPSGLKLFTYTLVDMSLDRASMTNFRKKEVERGTKSLDETRRKKLSKTYRQMKREEIEAFLERTLTENSYCHDGYTVKNFYIEDNRSEVRGECNDRATGSDREKFVPKGTKGSSATPGVLKNDNLIVPK